MGYWFPSDDDDGWVSDIQRQVNKQRREAKAKSQAKKAAKEKRAAEAGPSGSNSTPSGPSANSSTPAGPVTNKTTPAASNATPFKFNPAAASFTFNPSASAFVPGGSAASKQPPAAASASNAPPVGSSTGTFFGPLANTFTHAQASSDNGKKVNHIKVGHSVARKQWLRPMESPWFYGRMKKRKLITNIPRVMKRVHPEFIHTLPITWNGFPIPVERTFHSFERLPMELKLMIWRYAFPEAFGESRVLTFRYAPERKVPLLSTPQLGVAAMSVQVLMSINRETRNLGLATYGTLLPVNAKGLIWINPEKDIIMLSEIKTEKALDMWQEHSEITSKIINLAFSRILPSTGIVDNHSMHKGQQLLYFLNMFPNLKRVFIRDCSALRNRRVLNWAATENSVIMRLLEPRREYPGDSEYISKLQTWPDVWDCGVELGIEPPKDGRVRTMPSPTSRQLEMDLYSTSIDEPEIDLPDTIVGCGSRHIARGFSEFLRCAEALARPEKIPKNCNWGMLKNIKFYPLVELVDPLWPVCHDLSKDNFCAESGPLDVVQFNIYSDEFNTPAIRVADHANFSWLRSRTYIARCLGTTPESVRDLIGPPTGLIVPEGESEDDYESGWDEQEGSEDEDYDDDYGFYDEDGDYGGRRAFQAMLIMAMLENEG